MSFYGETSAANGSVVAKTLAEQFIKSGSYHFAWIPSNKTALFRKVLRNLLNIMDYVEL